MSFFDKLKKGMNIERPSDFAREDDVREFGEEENQEEINSGRDLSPDEAKEKPKRKPRTKKKAAADADIDADVDIIKDDLSEIEESESAEQESESALGVKKEIQIEDASFNSKPKVTMKTKKILPDPKSWFKKEGQLAVDIYQTEDELVVQSAVAGVKPEDLDISVENDILSIRGTRENPAENLEKNYFCQECYWGPFSKEIVLPVETDPSRTKAEMREGVLTIRIPKIERERKRKILVKE